MTFEHGWGKRPTSYRKVGSGETTIINVGKNSDHLSPQICSRCSSASYIVAMYIVQRLNRAYRPEM